MHSRQPPELRTTGPKGARLVRRRAPNWRKETTPRYLADLPPCQKPNVPTTWAKKLRAPRPVGAAACHGCGRPRAALQVPPIPPEHPLEVLAVHVAATAGLLCSSLVERQPKPPVERRSLAGIVSRPGHAGQSGRGGRLGRQSPSRWRRTPRRDLAALRVWRRCRHDVLAAPRVEGDRADLPAGRGPRTKEPRTDRSASL